MADAFNLVRSNAGSDLADGMRSVIEAGKRLQTLGADLRVMNVARNVFRRYGLESAANDTGIGFDRIIGDIESILRNPNRYTG